MNARQCSRLALFRASLRCVCHKLRKKLSLSCCNSAVVSCTPSLLSSLLWQYMFMRQISSVFDIPLTSEYTYKLHAKLLVHAF